MIRPEFFERKDLTAAQRCFLEFMRAFFNTLGGAADAFEKDLPDAVLQTAHRTAVIDELAQNAVSRYTFRSGRETKQFFDALFLARSGAEVLRRLCTYLKQHEDEALDALGEDYTETEIRLVRIKFLSEMAN